MKRHMTVALCLVGLAGGTIQCIGVTEQEAAKQLGLVKYELPTFPPVLKGEGVTAGSASVILTHDARGQPVDVLLLDATQPEFGEAALKAVRDWQFAPAATEGSRVQRTPAIRINFSTKGVIIVPTGGRGFDFSFPPLSASADSINIPTFDRLDQVPKVTGQPMPRFPPALIERGEPGRVNVEFLVDAEGRVRVPVVREETATAFGDEALAALATWQFEVPKLNGRPVIAATKWEFTFSPSAAVEQQRK